MHAAHEPPQGLDEQREQHRRPDRRHGHGTEQLGQRVALEQPGDPPRDQVASRDGEQPDAHQEPDDARRGELRGEAQSDRVQARLPELLEEIDPDGSKAPQKMLANTKNTAIAAIRFHSTSVKPRNPDEEVGEPTAASVRSAPALGAIRAMAGRSRSRPRTYWIRPSVMPTPAQANPACQSTRWGSQSAMSPPAIDAAQTLLV